MSGLCSSGLSLVNNGGFQSAGKREWSGSRDRPERGKRVENRTNTERIRYYEELMGKAEQALCAAEQAAELLRELAAYYTGPKWKEDFAADEAGQLPADLKRGVLSEDGIYNLLERGREIGLELGKAVEEESEIC